MRKALLLLAVTLITGCTQLSLVGEEVRQEKLRIKWIGQAGFMIESGEERIYIDPYSASIDLLKGEIILITHADFDHCDQPSINRLLKEEGMVFATIDCGMKLGVSNFMAVEPEKNYTFNDIKIMTVHAYSLTDNQHARGMGVGYVFEIEGYRIYYAGDTELIPELTNLKDIDIAILPVSIEEYSMNKDDAVTAARIINANYTIPMQTPDIQTAREFKSRLPDLNVELLTDKDLVFYEKE